MKPLLCLVIIATMTSCFSRTRVVYTPLPQIPLTPLPALSGEVEADLRTTGAEAMRLHALIKRYNEIAEGINRRNDVETPTITFEESE